MTYNEREVTFEIKKHIGVITEHPTGWKKELNLVSWNGHAPKYDIRDWSPDHEQLARGITLTEEEMGRIIELVEGNINEK